MTPPFNQSKLERYRRTDLEAVIRGVAQSSGTVIAGDIVLGSKSFARSIRFSFTQVTDPGYEGQWVVGLSAVGHTKCSDQEVRRFLKYAESPDRNPTELPNKGVSPYVRSFKLKEA